MPALRLAHLSDPHLALALPRGRELWGKRGLSALSWRLRRHRLHRPEVAEALREDLLAARPDAVAVGGDLVNFSLEREFEGARHWLERLGPPDRVLLVPGNHEALSPGWAERMARHWGPYAPELPRRVRLGDAALILVSTACVTPPFFAGGRLDRQERATALIAEARAEGRVPVVLMHHPPTPLTRPRKALQDLAEAADALRGAALILHGHTHRAELSRLEGPRGPVPVLGIPSFSMAAGGRDPAGAWRLLEIDGPSVTVTERAITAAGDVTSRTPLFLRLPCQPAGDRPD
ncbi:MAG: metallophosphoesterase [Pseudomonadota bacterium]